MSRRLPVLCTALVAGLLVLPACDKKRDDTQPGGTPPAPLRPEDMPRTGPDSKRPKTPETQTDSTLPALPGPLPLYATANDAQRQISENNLQQIGLAFHNHHDKLGGFPVGFRDRSGNLGLSWRVALLPFLNQENLYKQFKLDEPWDSETNKKLIEKMPKVFAAPQKASTSSYTFYRSFRGQGAVLPAQLPATPPNQPVIGTRIPSISDGASNTLLVAEAAEPVIWTKPDDLPFTPGQPPKLGGGIFGNGFAVVFCDGSTRFLPRTISAETLSNLIQVNDNQSVELPKQ